MTVGTVDARIVTEVAVGIATLSGTGAKWSVGWNLTR